MTSAFQKSAWTRCAPAAEPSLTARAWFICISADWYFDWASAELEREIPVFHFRKDLAGMNALSFPDEYLADYTFGLRLDLYAMDRV